MVAEKILESIEKGVISVIQVHKCLIIFAH